MLVLELELLLKLMIVTAIALMLKLLEQMVVMLLLMMLGLVIDIGLVMKLALLLLLLLLLLALGLCIRSSRGAELEQIQQVCGAIRVGRHGATVDGRRRRRWEIHGRGREQTMAQQGEKGKEKKTRKKERIRGPRCRAARMPFALFQLCLPRGWCVGEGRCLVEVAEKEMNWFSVERVRQEAKKGPVQK
jgi:hypothetical protein